MKLKKTIFTAALCMVTVAPSMAYATVKIGFLATLSTPSASVGRGQLDGFNLAVEQLGGKLGGQPVEMFVVDDQTKPDASLIGLSRLLDNDKVDVVTGLTSTNVLMALQAKIESTDVPFIGTISGPSATAGALCKPNLFIMSWQSDMPAEVIGKYLTDKGITRISTLTPNHLGGKDKVSGVKRTYSGEVIDEIYTPLTQLDFAAELTQVASTKPQAIYIFYPGGIGVSFVRQYKQMGLDQQFPFYSTNTIEGEEMEAMGDAAIGAIVGDTWTPGMPNEQTKQFVAAFKNKYKRLPSAYAAFSYDAAMMLNAAIGSLNGDVSDKKALQKAIKNAKFQSLRGAFRFGTNNYPVQNYHMFRVEKDEAGAPVHKMLAENVFVDKVDPYAASCPLK